MLGAALKGTRFAGKHLANLGKFLFAGQGKGEIALRLGPDAAFGVMEAAMTPGDLGDKLIAGTGSALGGAGGGLLLGKLGGKNSMLGTALDMAGSIGGDFVGRAGADQVLRAKDSMFGTGQGLNPYERLNEEQQRLYAQQIEAQTLAKLGLMPGSTQSYLIEQGLA